MSEGELFDREEFSRWFSQAENDLSSARHDTEVRSYNWACFKAQQAAECAVKALLRGLGKIAVGHSVLKLIELLGEAGVLISEGLKGDARILDKHYIPPRYPNAYPAGSPFEFYDEKTAQDSLVSAQRIVDFIRIEREKIV